MRNHNIHILLLLLSCLLLHCGSKPGEKEPTTTGPTVQARAPGRAELARSNLITLQAHAQTWPKNKDVMFFLGENLRRGEQFDEALIHYERALTIDLMDDEARVARAFALIKLQQWERVREALEEDMRFFPSEISFVHMLARVLAACPDDSVRDGTLAAQYVQALIPHGVDVGLAETIAMVWAESGQFDKAVAAQQDVLRLAREQGLSPMPHMLANLQSYVDGKPCRSPWPDDSPIFTQRSFVATADYGPDPNASWKKPGLSMQERLKLIIADSKPMNNTFMNAQRAEIMGAQVKQATDDEALVNALTPYSLELLRSGRSEEAIEAMEQLTVLLEKNNVVPDGEENHWILRNTALAWLRLGEQENCLENHTTESCLLPIREGGVHRLERGSRGAVTALEKLLKEFPEDINARWLLNIAYMTLGEYPDKVPGQWLIDPKHYESEGPMHNYRDAAGALGLDIDSLAGGSILEDFDNDGLLDVMASSWGLNDPLFLARNNGDGTFTNHSSQAGLDGLTSGLNMVTTDYNNDGYVDVLILRGAWLGSAGDHPNSLLRNNGDFTFTDVTEKAGLLSYHPTQTAAWFDYNNDGLLDVFIGNETSGMDEHPCRLYRNNGNETFTDIAVEAGVAHLGFVKGVAAGDYDNDGMTDLFLSCMNEVNVLYRNMGADESGVHRFENVALTAGVERPLSSFPAWFFDYDNDGWLDLFVSDYSSANNNSAPADQMGLPVKAEHSRLYRNKGDGAFEDVTETQGLGHILVGMGANFGDIDDDGYLDIYVGTGNPDLGMLIPNRMFRNNGGTGFSDVTTAGGFGHLQKGHGISFGDLDNDGDTDIHATMGGAYSGDTYRNALFANPGYGNNWVLLELEGQQTNRVAVGAQISLVLITPQGERKIVRTVSSGGSFGASPFRQHIGLGRESRIKHVTVFWPGSGLTRIYDGIERNNAYLIREEDLRVRKINLESFSIPQHRKQHHH